MRYSRSYNDLKHFSKLRLLHREWNTKNGHKPTPDCKIEVFGVKALESDNKTRNEYNDKILYKRLGENN